MRRVQFGVDGFLLSPLELVIFGRVSSTTREILEGAPLASRKFGDVNFIEASVITRGLDAKILLVV